MCKMKGLVAVLAITVSALVCTLAAVGSAQLMHWIDARPELVAATRPWLHLTTLVLVGVAAIRMARRRAD
jgi:nicotinamide riboside transporter PnuC